MAESSWPTVAGSRVVDDNQYEQMAVGWAPEGIIGTVADTAVVYGDSSGRQVKVRAAKKSLVRGHGWESDPSTAATLAIGSNTSGSTRIDLVVLRFTRSTLAVTTAVVAGTPGAGAPAATQTAWSTDVWEVPLATVTVANGASTITAGDVADVSPVILHGSAVAVRSAAALALCFPTVPGAGARVYQVDTGWWWTSNGTSWCLQPGQIIARANRTTDSSTTTSEVGVLRLPVGTIPAGQNVQISTSDLFLTSSAAGDVVSANIRYTTDGSNPSTASARLANGAARHRVGFQNYAQSAPIQGTYAPVSDSNLTVLLTVSRLAGSGNAFIDTETGVEIEMIATAMGTDPGDTGVDI
jgi:hypothetical protein